MRPTVAAGVSSSRAPPLWVGSLISRVIRTFGFVFLLIQFRTGSPKAAEWHRIIPELPEAKLVNKKRSRKRRKKSIKEVERAEEATGRLRRIRG